MIDTIVEFLQSLNIGEEIITSLCAMIPLIELKGAIPIGVRLGNPLIYSAFFAYLGSTLISIPLFFALIPVFNLLKKIGFIKRIVEKIEAYLMAKAKKMAEKSEEKEETAKNKFLFFALLIFVAVPFPITGVWTGTAIAVFLKMKFHHAFAAISIGNLIAGTIITLLTFFFKPYVDIIIYALLVLALLMLILTIYKISKAKP